MGTTIEHKLSVCSLSNTNYQVAAFVCAADFSMYVQTAKNTQVYTCMISAYSRTNIHA